MNSRSMTKRTFLKSIGLLALLGMIAHWFKGFKNNAYPINVHKDPNAIPRQDLREI